MSTDTFQRFADAIRDNQRSGVVLGFLRPLETDSISRELRLKENAVQRGTNDLPETTDRLLDAVEQRIIQRVESEWTWQTGELLNNLRAYANRILGYSIPAEFQKLCLMAQNALARLRAAGTTALADLGPLQEEYLGARKEYDTFRAKHKIQRPPRNPSRRWTTAGILFILIAVESVLNGVFFAKGSEFGLIGGVGTAIGISGVNVALAFLVGLGPARWMHRRNLLIKLAGFILTCGSIFALLVLHALAGHLREATAQVGENQALEVAWTTFRAVPWALHDLQSYYLFGLGVLFAISALWKGYSFDDPMPGYGSVYRRMVHARDAYSDEHDELFSDLEDIKEETVEHLRAGIERIPLFPQHAAHIRAERAALMEQFRAYETAIETAANQLLKTYRDENRLARRTPPPQHFDERWTPPQSALNSAAVATLIADANVPIGDVDECLRELRDLSRSVLAEYEKLMTKYPHPTEMG
jgi:hypothetical protein